MSHHLIESKDITSLVQSFYNNFPFDSDSLGNSYPLDLDWRFSVEAVHSICSGMIVPLIMPTEKIRILDAGCGTGLSTNFLANQNLDSEILAIDISTKSLSLAKKRINKSGANLKAEIRFKEISIYDLNVENKYDYINSIGMLNHVKNPLDALQKMDSLLSENGIIHLSLCANFGRRYIKSIQNAFKILNIDNVLKDITLVRSLIQDLPDENLIKKDYQSRCKKGFIPNTEFADMYLHPFENDFKLSDIFFYLDKLDLKILEFYDFDTWRLDRFLKGELLSKANSLDKRDQLKLVESLDPEISFFDVFVGRKDFKIHRWDSEKDMLSTTAKINNYFVDLDRKIFFDSNMNKIHIDNEEIMLLECINNNPEKPLRDMEMPSNTSPLGGLVKSLLGKKMLLLYPL